MCTSMFRQTKTYKHTFAMCGVLRTLVLVKSLGELVDAGGHLQTLLEHSALALNAHVARPLDVAAEVALGGEDVAANTVVTGIFGEKVSLVGLPVLADLLGRRGLLDLSFTLSLRMMSTVSGRAKL